MSIEPSLKRLLSRQPSRDPSRNLTTRPTTQPSTNPTSTVATSNPTLPFSPFNSPVQPSDAPIQSIFPSDNPLDTPTTTVKPSPGPTRVLPNVPSLVPTFRPSDRPTTSDRPTSEEVITSTGLYSQDFERAVDFFDETDEFRLLEELFENYTIFLLPEDDQGREDLVNTTVKILEQVTREIDKSTYETTLTYRCTYASRAVSVDDFPNNFMTFINSDLTKLTDDINGLDIQVDRSLEVKTKLVDSPAPSISQDPSSFPSQDPSSSQKPSQSPSTYHTNSPSRTPTTPEPTNPEKCLSPSNFPSATPTMTIESGGNFNPWWFFLLLLIPAIYLCYRCRRLHKQWNYPHVGGTPAYVDPRIYKPNKHYRPMPYIVEYPAGDGIDSQNGSRSNISLGDNLDNDSRDEMDNTNNLQDEFDQYKIQNFDQLQSGVEGNKPGSEGPMSDFVTKVLMGNYESMVNRDELYWGCDPKPGRSDVEASALCDVSEWLRRNDKASMERKGNFMQNILDKMVTSVRYGVLGADEATRTIHESATLLGFKLAEELPRTTVIVTGLRKTVEKQHIFNAMKEFGEIDVVGLASCQRGYGIVRYRTAKAVDRVMCTYREKDIEIHDVNIILRVLKPGAEFTD